MGGFLFLLFYIVVGCFIFKILTIAKEKKVDKIDDFFDNEEEMVFLCAFWGLFSFIIVPIVTIYLIYWCISKLIDYALGIILSSKNKTVVRTENDTNDTTNISDEEFRTSKTVSARVNKNVRRKSN